MNAVPRSDWREPDVVIRGPNRAYEIIRDREGVRRGRLRVARLRGQLGFTKLVAIKSLRRDRAEVIRALVVDEAHFRHANIVSTLDVVVEDDVVHVIMEYIEGPTLFDVVNATMTSMRRLPLPVVATIVHDVLLGLDHAHGVHAEAAGFSSRIHCDLAPRHVVVGFDGLARILNFGVPRAQSSDESPSPGKLAYLAPEQLLGGTINRTVDIYACGVLLWELLTGVRFFNHLRLLNPTTQDDVPKPSSRVWRVPAKLDAVVLKAMRRDPAKRFQTAAEMAEALAEAVPLATRAAVRTGLVALAEGRQKPESEPPPALAPVPPRNSMIRELAPRAPRFWPWLAGFAHVYAGAWHGRVRQWVLRTVRSRA